MRKLTLSILALFISLCALGATRTRTVHTQPNSQLPAFKCGEERQPVKIGTDPGAADVDVDIAHVQNTTIARMRNWASPFDNPKAFAPDEFTMKRISPHETTLYGVNATMIAYKLESNDSDYHLVLQDTKGRTMIAEVVNPVCAQESTFLDQIKEVRREFDTRFKKPTGKFREMNVGVRIIGIGFFDRVHDQRGVSEKNGIEIHPILKLMVLK